VESSRQAPARRGRHRIEDEEAAMPAAPTRTTPTRTDNPTRVQPRLDPERHYNPERLCPSQRRDGEKFSRP
jgi:hypothetical protein